MEFRGEMQTFGVKNYPFDCENISFTNAFNKLRSGKWKKNGIAVYFQIR